MSKSDGRPSLVFVGCDGIGSETPPPPPHARHIGIPINLGVPHIPLGCMAVARLQPRFRPTSSWLWLRSAPSTGSRAAFLAALSTRRAHNRRAGDCPNRPADDRTGHQRTGAGTDSGAADPLLRSVAATGESDGDYEHGRQYQYTQNRSPGLIMELRHSAAGQRGKAHAIKITSDLASLTTAWSSAVTPGGAMARTVMHRSSDSGRNPMPTRCPRCSINHRHHHRIHAGDDDSSGASVHAPNALSDGVPSDPCGPPTQEVEEARRA